MLKKLDKILIGLLVIVAVFIGLEKRWLAPFYDTSPQVQGEAETQSGIPGELKVYFLDVGQGDSTLIRTPAGNDILIDGGPDNTVIKKLGQYLPVNDWDIELMILTHPHADHVTGLVEVLKRYEVDKIVMTGVLHTTSDYLTWLDLIRENNITIELIDSQRELAIEDGLSLEIMFPNESFFSQTAENLNNTSIVAKLAYDDTSILFTGDLEIEEELLNKNLDLSADVYQAGHHGSNNANSYEFLKLVSPKYAVISAGRDNWFGHPHYRTLRTMEKLEIKIFCTDQDGDIVLVSDGNNFYPQDR